MRATFKAKYGQDSSKAPGSRRKLHEPFRRRRRWWCFFACRRSKPQGQPTISPPSRPRVESENNVSTPFLRQLQPHVADFHVRQAAEEATRPVAFSPEPSGTQQGSDGEDVSEDTTEGGAEEFVFRGREVTSASKLLTPAAQRKRKQARQGLVCSSQWHLAACLCCAAFHYLWQAQLGPSRWLGRRSIAEGQ